MIGNGLENEQWNDLLYISMGTVCIGREHMEWISVNIDEGIAVTSGMWTGDYSFETKNPPSLENFVACYY